MTNFVCDEFTRAHDKLSLVGGLARVLDDGPMCRSRMYFDCSLSTYLAVGSNESHNGRLSGSRFCRQSVRFSFFHWVGHIWFVYKRVEHMKSIMCRNIIIRTNGKIANLFISKKKKIMKIYLFQYWAQNASNDVFWLVSALPTKLSM